MSRPEFQVNKLSKGAKRRRRRSPLYQALKDLIGHDSQGIAIAGSLFAVGITTPEELRAAPYADLRKIQGLSRSAMSRISSVRCRLNAVHPRD